MMFWRRQDSRVWARDLGEDTEAVLPLLPPSSSDTGHGAGHLATLPRHLPHLRGEHRTHGVVVGEPLAGPVLGAGAVEDQP